MLTCKTFLLAFCLVAAAFAANPRVELLWPAGAPGAVGTEDLDKPSLAIYLPPGKPSAASGVIVCPGGGYGGLAMDHEGSQIAEWLNAHGVAAFVLKYRLGPRYHHPAPLEDAQRAIRYVRENAATLGIAPDRIGIWGFSAGGHLAATTGTHFDASTRPDFMILCYPVISFTTPYTHQGSLKNLLGEHPDPKLVENLSNELQVTAQTPPAFLFYTNEDPVRPENAVLFYMAMRKAGVPAELHIYERGPHGVGLAQKDPVLSSWPPRLADWMKIHGWMY
jgi:acetyl esterase/lipase